MTTPQDEIRPTDKGNSCPQYRRHLTPYEVKEMRGLNEEEKIYQQEYERVMKLKRHSPTFEEITGEATFQGDYWGKRKNEIKLKAMLDAFRDKRIQ